jgi:hypothetical protein
VNGTHRNYGGRPEEPSPKPGKMKKISPWSPKFFRSKTDQNWPFCQQKLQFSEHFQLKQAFFKQIFRLLGWFFVKKDRKIFPTPPQFYVWTKITTLGTLFNYCITHDAYFCLDISTPECLWVMHRTFSKFSSMVKA